MDEPCWAWPFWKFGLKKDDLTTTLHDRYNTFPSAIQDPEAFHHDVCELSTEACTRDEFERLMEERKKLRLKELNGMLENASFEIIGNPSLIGTEQWQYAIQLFRTKSLDSLVRYFASYLPQDHPWHHEPDSAINTSIGTAPIIECHGPILFDEPEDVDDVMHNNQVPDDFFTSDVSPHQPVRSMTMGSEDSGVSVTDCHYRKHNPHTHNPARAVSPSESEPEHITANMQDSISTLNDDEGISQFDDSDTPSTSISDLSDVDGSEGKGFLVTTIVDNEVDAEYLSISRAQLYSIDSMESDSPTPKAEPARSPAAATVSCFDTKLSSLRPRSLSSTHSHPHHAHTIQQAYRNYHSTSRQLRRRDGSLDRDRARRGAVGGSISHQKEVAKSARSRRPNRRCVGG